MNTFARMFGARWTRARTFFETIKLFVLQLFIIRFEESIKMNLFLQHYYCNKLWLSSSPPPHIYTFLRFLWESLSPANLLTNNFSSSFSPMCVRFYDESGSFRKLKHWAHYAYNTASASQYAPKIVCSTEMKPKDICTLHHICLNDLAICHFVLNEQTVQILVCRHPEIERGRARIIENVTLQTINKAIIENIVCACLQIFWSYAYVCFEARFQWYIDAIVHSIRLDFNGACREISICRRRAFLEAFFLSPQYL